MHLQTQRLKLSIYLLSFITSVTAFQLGVKPANAGKLSITDFINECQNNGGTVTITTIGSSCSKPVRGITYFPTAKIEIDINKKQHDTQGRDPFLGKFISDNSISSFLSGASSTLNLTLDVNSSSIELFGPEIWGEPTINPNLIDGKVTLARDPVSGEIGLTDYSIRYDSFLINGVQSGINTILVRSENQFNLDFNVGTGDITAYLETITSNDLYPIGINPILDFGKVQVKVLSDNEIELVSSAENNQIIVPGVTGQPPSYPLGLAYIGTIASFDSNTGLLTFGDNLGNGLTPDVSIVSSPDGIYYSSPTNAENLVGASFAIEPLQFLGQDNSGSDLRYLFSDAKFSLSNSNGIFASGVLKNIGIETYSFGFTGDVVLDDNINFLSSPFIDKWRSNPTIQLLGPLAANSLIASSLGFTQNGTSGVDFTNLEPVPEPTSILGVLAFGILGAASTLKRKQK